MIARKENHHNILWRLRELLFFFFFVVGVFLALSGVILVKHWQEVVIIMVAWLFVSFMF